jgi:hypothetical protein
MAVRTSSVLRSCQLFARQSPPSLISLRLPAPSPLALSRSFSSHTSSTPSSTRRTFSSTPVSSYAAPSDSQVNSVEDPYQDEASRSPDLETKVKDLYAILDSVGTSMLTTRAPDSEELHSRASMSRPSFAYGSFLSFALHLPLPRSPLLILSFPLFSSPVPSVPC